MYLAADTAPSQPWWLITAGILGTVLVAYIAARGPVWLEKVRTRHHTTTPAEKVAGAEEVLREWLQQALKERDKAIKEVDRLNRRIDGLEKELYRLGWDGRSA